MATLESIRNKSVIITPSGLAKPVKVPSTAIPALKELTQEKQSIARFLLSALPNRQYDEIVLALIECDWNADLAFEKIESSTTHGFVPSGSKKAGNDKTKSGDGEKATSPSGRSGQQRYNKNRQGPFAPGSGKGRHERKEGKDKHPRQASTVLAATSSPSATPVTSSSQQTERNASTPAATPATTVAPTNGASANTPAQHPDQQQSSVAASINVHTHNQYGWGKDRPTVKAQPRVEPSGTDNKTHSKEEGSPKGKVTDTVQPVSSSAKEGQTQPATGGTPTIVTPIAVSGVNGARVEGFTKEHGSAQEIPSKESEVISDSCPSEIANAAKTTGVESICSKQQQNSVHQSASESKNAECSCVQVQQRKIPRPHPVDRITLPGRSTVGTHKKWTFVSVPSQPQPPVVPTQQQAQTLLPSTIIPSAFPNATLIPSQNGMIPGAVPGISAISPPSGPFVFSPAPMGSINANGAVAAANNRGGVGAFQMANPNQDGMSSQQYFYMGYPPHNQQFHTGQQMVMLPFMGQYPSPATIPVGVSNPGAPGAGVLGVSAGSPGSSSNSPAGGVQGGPISQGITNNMGYPQAAISTLHQSQAVSSASGAGVSRGTDVTMKK